jgi:membrane protease YdiL (CAAX protease family)
VVEEFFFRGFFYRALRNRMSIAVAALVDGAVFGIIHFQFDGVDGLLILPPLAVLGVLFCLVYEKTGTLLAPIGMHAFNNAVAFGVQADDGWMVSVAVAPMVFAALVVAGRRLPRGPVASPAHGSTVSRA